jgi:hypothetical protein
MTGRTVDLAIYTEAHNIDKCDHAMVSLKASMKWDEDVYGLEYDLDLFNIVAVDDFNMGAMENKYVAEGQEDSRASPPHRLREEGLAHPADASRSNLAAALALLSEVAAFHSFPYPSPNPTPPRRGCGV